MHPSPCVCVSLCVSLSALPFSSLSHHPVSCLLPPPSSSPTTTIIHHHQVDVTEYTFKLALLQRKYEQVGETGRQTGRHTQEGRRSSGLHVSHHQTPTHTHKHTHPYHPIFLSPYPPVLHFCSITCLPAGDLHDQEQCAVWLSHHRLPAGQGLPRGGFGGFWGRNRAGENEGRRGGGGRRYVCGPGKEEGAGVRCSCSLWLCLKCGPASNMAHEQGAHAHI